MIRRRLAKVSETKKRERRLNYCATKTCTTRSAACSKYSTIGRRKSFPSVLVSTAESGRRSKKSARSWVSRASGSVNCRTSRSRNYAARSAKLALERTGRYFVCEENDAAKAHQTAQSLKPDLILLDIAMPETDGGEVAARIQSDPALHRTPIVFLTALVTKAETTSGLRIQGHPFLAKPISIPDLITGIEENLPAHAPF